MKVVLLEDIEKLGRAGEVVEVADGYARNFLFPKALAVVATESRVQEADAHQARATRVSEKELAATQQLAELADQKTVRLERPMGPQGKLHGAVTANDIAAVIEGTLRILLPSNAVRLSEPIHEPGTYTVALEFPHGLEAEVTVIVTGASGNASAERTEKAVP